MSSVKFDSAILFGFIIYFVVITSAQNCSQSQQAYPAPCANSFEIKYPFWYNDLHSDYRCAYPGFEIACSNQTTPVMNISNQLYRLISINYKSRFVRLTELGIDKECPRPRRNFSLQQFGSSLKSAYGNCQFFYNCSSPPNGYIVVKYHLGCLDNSGQRSYAFPADTTPSPGYNWYRNCKEILVSPACAKVFRLIANAEDDYNEYPNLQTAKTLLYYGQHLLVIVRIARVLAGCAVTTQKGFFIIVPVDLTSPRNLIKLVLLQGNQWGVSPGIAPSNQPTFNSNHRQKGLSTGVKVLIGVFTGVGAILLLVFLIYRRILFSIYMVFTSYWRNNINGPTDVEIFLKSCVHLNVQRYKYSDIKKMTNSFKETLGQGGYGSVFKGKLKCDGRLVAVKLLNESKGKGEDFINEVATISRTNHVNVVSLLGFCTEGTKRALVYEFMPNGSLERFIYNEKTSSTPLGWEKLYQIALGIARGLEYLHRGCNMRILHFDIKPHNILLDQEFSPKISDFGLAKLCPTRESVVSMLVARGTIGYIAPEVYCRNFGGVSHKSDVYSYGMMVLEIIGRRKNIDPTVENLSEIYFPKWIYNQLNHLNQGINAERSKEIFKDETTKKMIIVALWCVQTQPADRPSMSKVVEMLEGSTKDLQIPPNPFQDLPSGSSP